MSKYEIIERKNCLPVYFDIHSTNNNIVPNHWHNHLEIIYIEKGSLLIVCGNSSYQLYEGDMFIVNSGKIHYTKSSNQTVMLLLQVPYEFLDQLIYQFGAIQFRDYFNGRALSKNRDYIDLVNYLKAMKKLYIENENGYQFLFNSQLQLLFHILYTKFSAPLDTTLANREAKYLERLKDIISYVEKHYAEPITLNKAAEIFALNPEYFCRFFKKNMGFTFLEYLNMVRLSHIYHDLVYTSDNVMEILIHHGFTNYKVFLRMFKSIYGIKPSQVKKFAE